MAAITNGRSIHSLEVGNIVQLDGMRLDIIKIENVSDFENLTKTVITWKEIPSGGELPKVLNGNPWSVGVHKDSDALMMVEA